MGINIDVGFYLVLLLYVFTPVSVGHLLLRKQERYLHYTTPKTRFILSYAIGLLCTFTAEGIIILLGLPQQFFFAIFGASITIVGFPASRLAAKRIEVSSEAMYVPMEEKSIEYESDSLDEVLSGIMDGNTAGEGGNEENEANEENGGNVWNEGDEEVRDR